MIEVDSIIKGLKNKPTTGPDRISNIIIKNIPGISFILAELGNIMFLQASFPDSLKVGRIVLKYKNGSKDNLNNFRPLTLLNSLSKVFEKLINTRIRCFLRKCAILSNHQFGYKKGISVEDALLEVHNTIIKAKVRGSCVLGLTLDVSKAFDSIPHDFLLGKLERYGFRGNFFLLLKSYFENRYIYYEADGICSDYALIRAGVPQGSILGPQLYSIYANDLHSLEDPGLQRSIICYADDNFSLKVGSTYALVREDLEVWAVSIHNWYIDVELQEVLFCYFCKCFSI